MGELCSFDAFLGKYNLSDPALRDLAVIVRGADTDRLDLALQAAGLLAVSLGLSCNFSDHHEMLQPGHRGLRCALLLVQTCPGGNCPPGMRRRVPDGSGQPTVP